MEQEALDNYEKLAEKLYRKGFGDKHNEELKQYMNDGLPEFSIISEATIDKDQMDYRSNFRRDEATDKVYYNSIDAILTAEVNGAVVKKEHTFPADQLITATEMHRMLKHGELVAVNKNLFNKDGKAYNTWIVLDNNGPKDQYGNYPIKTFHENYFIKKLEKPFIIKDELKNLPLPVKELEGPRYAENIEKALHKANLVKVTIFQNGQEAAGFLSANPQSGRVDLYDANMKLVVAQQQSQSTTEQKATTAQAQGEVKKKPWEDRKVNWKKEQSKGRSM